MKNDFFSISQLIGMLLMSLALFSFYSCSKDNDYLNSISKDSDSKTIPVDYNLDQLNGIDYAKVKFSKILSTAIANHPPIKEVLFNMVFDEKTKESQEVFILDLITSQNISLRSESIRDLLVYYGEVTEEEIDDLVNTFCQDYPNVVIDVPAFVEWAYRYEATSDRFEDVYQNYPFVIMPNTHEPNSNGKWTGYGDLTDDGVSSLYEIGNNETYEDVIPFIVKAAERKLMFTDELTLINGRNVIESYVGNGLSNELVECFTEQIGKNKAVEVLCGNSYEVLDMEDLINIIENCSFLVMTEEICDDGIDNDDDGLIDCEDPECDCEEEIEICDDGIDNDGDGLIDAADPDCNPGNLEICCDGIDNDGDGLIDSADPDCCYRDCRTDHNYLLAHKFDNIVAGLSTTNSQVPGGERYTQLKYQITTMEKSTPTSDPIAVHHNQIVVARTYILYCEIPSFSSLGSLTPEEISTLCLEDHDLYYNQTVQGFLGGLVFDFDPLDTEWGTGLAQGYITFELRDEIYVRVMHPKFVIKPLQYLRAKRDWDASLIANELRMSIFEVDEIESTSTSSQTTEITRTHSISAEFGQQFSIEVEIPGTGTTVGGGSNFTESYNFGQSQQYTTSTSFTVVAKDVLELGDLSLFYCDEEAHNGQSYSISEEALGTDRSMHRIYERNTMLDWWDIIEDNDN